MATVGWRSSGLSNADEGGLFCRKLPGLFCNAQGAPQPRRRVPASFVLGGVSEARRLRIRRTRESAYRRRHGSDVLELMPNPAGDVICCDDLLDSLGSLLALNGTHLKSKMKCSGGYFDNQRIDRHCMRAQITTGSCRLR